MALELNITEHSYMEVFIHNKNEQYIPNYELTFGTTITNVILKKQENKTQYFEQASYYCQLLLLALRSFS